MISRLSQLHENHVLLAWAQGIPGRLTVWATASALLYWHGSTAIIPAAVAAVMIRPAYRRMILSIAAVGVIGGRFLEFTGEPLVNEIQWAWLGALSAAITCIGCLYIAYFLTRRINQWPALFRRHPVLLLHVLIWLVLALSIWPGLGVLGLASYFAWRLSYLVVSANRNRLADTRFRDHLFYLVPTYGGTTTPFGKGLDFLSQHEAGTGEAMARSQLAGIKLLLLAGAWIYARELLDVMLFGKTAGHLPTWSVGWMAGWTLDWPRLPEVIQSGVYPTWYVGWAVSFLELVRATLSLAALGHVIVGCLRLLGFNVFRNTYKPLLSESLLEFWSRYYYYFKELLVDFFFYPTYLRLRRFNPTARMFTAVFAAAFVGNMYHHVLIHPYYILHFDIEGLWMSCASRMVYCFLLSAGIWISMLRQQTLRAAHSQSSHFVRMRRIAWVWTFYAIIQIWNVHAEGADIQQRTGFLLSLFGF